MKRSGFTARTMMLAAGAIVASLAPPAAAQWSLGAKGDRTAPAGQHRYAFLVFANPRPGQEQQFNDWYDYEHLGDLVQLPGWTGAQRFRLVTDLHSRPTARGYEFGYLALWDQQASDPQAPRQALDDAQDGGKARRSATFEYRGGASPKALYETAGPRRTRPDKSGFSIPAVSDQKSPRSNRYIVLDFASLPGDGGGRATAEKVLDARIGQVLRIPGWMAAQRFHAVPTPGSRGSAASPSPFPDSLTIWEIEAVSADAAQAAFVAAGKAGGIAPSPALAGSATTTFWQPIGPYVDRDAFAR